jgi:hypothetical protein
MACASDEDVVFNPDTSPAREIHTRLHGNDHAGPQLGLLADRHSRRFMNLQAGAVAQAVTEGFPETCALDNLSRHGVDLLTCLAGADRVNCSELRLEHNSI